MPNFLDAILGFRKNWCLTIFWGAKEWSENKQFPIGKWLLNRLNCLILQEQWFGRTFDEIHRGTQLRQLFLATFGYYLALLNAVLFAANALELRQWQCRSFKIPVEWYFVLAASPGKFRTRSVFSWNCQNSTKTWQVNRG